LYHEYTETGKRESFASSPLCCFVSRIIRVFRPCKRCCGTGFTGPKLMTQGRFRPRAKPYAVPAKSLHHSMPCIFSIHSLHLPDAKASFPRSSGPDLPETSE
jgi:hypothetical protein